MIILCCSHCGNTDVRTAPVGGGFKCNFCMKSFTISKELEENEESSYAAKQIVFNEIDGEVVKSIEDSLRLRKVEGGEL